VRVALGEAGAERFRAFTAAHVKRRLAIVVDGRVESAPVIQTEIPGGVVSITMGAGAPEEQQAQARRLADRLMGR
jgi:preprotein translocase subunit SecD